MSLNYQDIILLTYPFILGIGYFIFLLFKKENLHDLFFKYDPKGNLQSIFQRVEKLEKIKNEKLPKVHDKIKYFELKSQKIKRKITYYADTIDDYLIFQYFNQFSNRWIAYYNSTFFEKLIFASFISYGFLICYLINPFLLIIFPLPIITGLLLFLFYNLCFHFFQFIFFWKGSLRNTLTHFDEMIKALKIGGRNTQTLPDNAPGVYWYYGYGGGSGFGSGGTGWGGFGGGSSGGGGAGGSW